MYTTIHSGTTRPNRPLQTTGQESNPSDKSCKECKFSKSVFLSLLFLWGKSGVVFPAGRKCHSAFYIARKVPTLTLKSDGNAKKAMTMHFGRHTASTAHPFLRFRVVKSDSLKASNSPLDYCISKIIQDSTKIHRIIHFIHF